MPIKINSTGGGSVSIDVPSTGGTYTLTAPANNATIFTTAGGAITGNVAFTSNNVSIGGQTISPAVGMRNRIINGDMRIDQRNSGAVSTVTMNGFGTVDRWNPVEDSDAVVTTQQSSTVPTGYGFSNSVVMTVSTADTSIGASQYCYIRQSIEGLNVADLDWGTASAKTVTVSFWVRSSLTGTYCMTVSNSNEDRIYPSEYTINSANTWEYKTITVPGDTTGTWFKDIQAGLRVWFWQSVGSTYNGGINNTWNGASKYCTSNQVNWLATVGNTFYLTGVQFEVGSVATPFERRMYGAELALCKRYYWQMVSGTAQEVMINGTAYQSNQWESVITYPVEMRSVPTITFTPTSTWQTRIGGISPSSAFSYYYGDVIWARSQILIYAPYSGLTQGHSNAMCSKNPSIAGMYFSSEL